MTWYKQANDDELLKAGKFLALVLRHRPEKINLTIANDGWASVDELAAKSGFLSREMIEEVVRTDTKKRYALSDDGQYVKANYGHSFNVNLGLEAAEPPPVLYHGTADRTVDAIKAEGLTSRSRQFVHLSPDRGTATSVGSRHGNPVILEVDTAAMVQAGYEFFQPAFGTWMVKDAPVGFIRFPDNELVQNSRP